MDKKSFGLIAAAAAASMLSAAPVFAGPKVVKGHACQNNGCKGKSECKGMGNNNCKGQNECKGHGWLNFESEKDCAANGGKWAKADGAHDAAKEKAAPHGKAEKK